MSRISRTVCLACLALGGWHMVSVAFSSVSRIARRAEYETGKVNVGAEVSDTEVPPPPPPVLECDEGCMTAIFDCLDEGCSVDALLKLDKKLAEDEQRIVGTVKEIESVQKTAYSPENAGTLAWLNNFLSRSGSLRAQLQALQGVKDSDLLQQIVKAASVAFGGGRPNDYPKVGVSPYTS
ncbi:unnamed protein product [Effrenium voratum]|uniref:Uncharacterized protein n=1 Tax=Effrenium voratum TaxID=2562239 RepID=A0AA36JKX7_9DINO|nr:unnamed protein product [Effrenium voratum]CAJ1408123.1 unnamed protein product [Effrenium voratum]CAJ1434691.1 unnamed protein product [Effrenium voratum]|mmetsp:Transcript_8941/g.21216  ORF Transcript_8941/g.21216 Transcript_8941/m.21216 type:complete len:180 (+) Transcript_8941:77-616(+)